LRPGVDYELSTRWTDGRTMVIAVLTPAGERAVEATARLGAGSTTTTRTQR
jgi:hypothetical protein